MNIGLDFDGVIHDAGHIKSLGAKKLYGIDIPPVRFKKELLVPHMLTAEQYRQVQHFVYGTRELSTLMKPVTDALLYINKLKSEGHFLQVITAREGSEADIAHEFLQQHSCPLPITSTGFGNPKTNACKGLDVYVDDDFDKLEPLADIVPNRFLFTWEYNAHITVASTLAQRVHLWRELYQHIKRIGDCYGI